MPVGIAKVTQAFGESYTTNCEAQIFSNRAFDDLQQVQQRDFQWVLPRGEELVDQLGYQLDIT
jgi:hypothetical protein